MQSLQANPLATRTQRGIAVLGVAVMWAGLRRRKNHAPAAGGSGILSRMAAIPVPVLAVAVELSLPSWAAAAVLSVLSNQDFPRNPAAAGCVCESTAPASVCTLRAAIQTANDTVQCPGIDTVRLLAGGPYVLTRVGADDTALNGDLDITESLIVEGGASVVDAAAIGDRIFDVHASAAVVFIIGLKMIKGAIPKTQLQVGGCMRIQSSDVTLSAVIVGGDPALSEGCETWAGGGVSINGGKLRLVTSIVSDNVALGEFLNPGHAGGVLAIASEVEVLNSHVIFNLADGGGGGMSVTDGSLTVRDTSIANNRAIDEGGGGRFLGPFQIVGSSFANNVLTDVTAAGGGGFYQGPLGEPGDIVVVDSEVRENRAGRGGGFALRGVLTAQRVDVVSNGTNDTAFGGGGVIYPTGLLFLDESSVHINRAQLGAGLFVQGRLNSTNSSFGENEAVDEGGAIYTDADAIVELLHGSIRLNNGGSGTSGGIHAIAPSTNQLDRSILYENSPSDCSGPVASLGQVLRDPAGCVVLAGGSPADVNGAPVGWGTFGYNPPQPPVTATHEITGTNPAVGAAVPCGVPIDQRGLTRGADPCDVGAYEHDPGPAASADADADGVPDRTDNCPQTWNPDQSDTAGVGSDAPDGSGDACQCGDLTGEGRGDDLDVYAYRLGLTTTTEELLPTASRCNLADPPSGEVGCDVLDVTVLRRAVGGVGPGAGQLCTAATGA